MIPALMELPLFALSAFSFYCLGRLAIGRFLENWPREAFWALCSACGMGLFAYFTYVLGLSGILRGPVLLGALVLFAAIGGALRWLRLPDPRGLSGTVWAGILVSVFLYTAAHSPLIGHDALCYHLYLAKVFAQAARVFSIPYHENSDWPLLWEMLFTAAYRLSGAGLAKSWHVYSAVLTGMLAAGTAKRFGLAKNSALAALLVLLSPLIANLAPTAYIDVGLSLFTAAALFLFVDWRQDRRMSALVLSGLFLGLALATKFLAVFTAVILAAALVADVLSTRGERRGRWTGVLFFTAAALLAGGYWYAKLWGQYGNPVHPYFGHWFGKGADILTHYETPISKNIIGLLSSPFWITFFPAKLSGFAEQPGPIFLLFAPLALILRRSSKALRFLGYFAAAYLTLWFSLYQNLRFLAPLVPALSVMAAGYDGLRERGRSSRAAAAAVFSLLLILEGTLLVYHWRREYRTLAGLETERSYLARTERVFAAADYMNGKYGKEAKLFLPNEVHLYYFDASVVRGNYLMQAYPDEFASGDLERGLSLLRRQGFTHILLFREESFEGRPFLQTLSDARPEQLERSGAALEKELPAGQNGPYLLFRLQRGQS